MLKYISVCSGIEAATVAWHPLGWEPVGFSEIEPFPSAVLAHHYPHVPNFGDMTKFLEWKDATIDVLVGGTPCQSFSVAGLRKGLADPRGNLMLTFLGIAGRYKPKWIVWENVPGVLSSNGGRDFGTFLTALGELGYGWAYRVLDAQWFGVAQRRRRVFVVGCLGDQRSAAKVLFESESVCRDSAPSREKREEVAPTVTASLGTGGPNDLHPMIAKTLTAWIGKRYDSETETMIPTIGFSRIDDGRDATNDLCPTLRTGGNANGVMAVAHPTPFGVGEKPDVAHCLRSGASKADKHESTTYVAHPTVLMDQGGSVMNVLNDGTVGTLRRETHGHEPIINQRMAVRRLTPMECERLQGFPDGYTDIKPKEKDTPDGPRYKALGNSMAVPVMNWIGKQIQMVTNER